MKKIISIFVLVLMCCFMLVACDTKETIDPVEGDTSRFQYIGRDTITQNGTGDVGDVLQYYVDNETQIVYVVIVNRGGNYTWAGVTPLIDADGTYTTYEEFTKD